MPLSPALLAGRTLRALVLAAALLPVAACAGARAQPPRGEPVVLLHGLALNATAMKSLAMSLREAGFRTCRVNYPSREYPIDTLAARFVLPKIRRCFPEDSLPLHFVTHSMGGILARRLEQLPDAPRFGRVVMISPPNKGSELADSLRGTKLLDWWGGPAGHELGTDSASMPNRLGPPSFEFGVIAATRSVEPWLSSMIPGRDDGKVAVKRTKLEGMRDFVAIPASHTFILWNAEAARQTAHFLRTGRFDHAEESGRPDGGK